MSTPRKNPKVDAYLHELDAWRKESEALRAILLDCGLTEELKWGKPCYTFEGHNVAIIQDFKGYCAVLFPKGALLKDPVGILVQQTENVQAARQIRFTNRREIVAQRKTVTAYVNQAIDVERAGREVKMKTTADFAVPVEFQARLDRDPALKKAFAALTPGRQRGYLLHFGGAKQSATRAARVAKYVPQILAGKGRED